MTARSTSSRIPAREDTYGVEAFFDQVHLQRLRADFVITLDVDQPTLAAMYERGLRISQVGSGSRKIKLDPVDVETLASDRSADHQLSAQGEIWTTS
jgi:hypothetical protein